MAQAYICRSPSSEVCKNFFTHLVTAGDLDEWLLISRDNGDYLNIKLNNENIDPKRFQRKNFGYVLGSPKLRYGVLNLFEDIACVFEQIIYRLYLLYQREEYTKEDAIKKEITDLLAETPGETGLLRKYQIACKSLSRLFQDEQKQESDPANKNKLENLIYVLQVFSNQIQDAIDVKLASDKEQPNDQQLMADKFGGATTGQRDQQSASIGQGGVQQISITRREVLKESLRQLFARVGG